MDWPGDRQIACPYGGSLHLAQQLVRQNGCGMCVWQRGWQEGFQPSRASERPLNRHDRLAAHAHQVSVKSNLAAMECSQSSVGQVLVQLQQQGRGVNSEILAWPGGPRGGRESVERTTLSGGSLGSCIDEERSQLR